MIPMGKRAIRMIRLGEPMLEPAGTAEAAEDVPTDGSGSMMRHHTPELDTGSRRPTRTPHRISRRILRRPQER